MKFLLPRVNIKGKLKLKDGSMMKACAKWHRESGRGMNWYKHMIVVGGKMQKQDKLVAWESLNAGEVVGEAPLFECGVV